MSKNKYDECARDIINSASVSLLNMSSSLRYHFECSPIVGDWDGTLIKSLAWVTARELREVRGMGKMRVDELLPYLERHGLAAADDKAALQDALFASQEFQRLLGDIREMAVNHAVRIIVKRL
jgi:hypothetical protein